MGTVLTAGYLLWMLQRVNLGEPSQEWHDKGLRDVDGYELAAWAPLVAAIIAIGVYPKIVTGASTGAIVDLVSKAFGG